jgi:hypothetical protein
LAPPKPSRQKTDAAASMIDSRLAAWGRNKVAKPPDLSVVIKKQDIHD